MHGRRTRVRMLLDIWLYTLLSTGGLLILVMTGQALMRSARRLLRPTRGPAPAALATERTAFATERVLVDSVRRP